MPRFRLSPEAERDIEAILAWTHREFGEELRLRYEELLVQAILDLAHDPARLETMERSELAKGAKTYHLLHSRDHLSGSIGRIRRPRHFLLYRVAGDGALEIGRVLHDSMDLARRLPPEFPSAGSEPEA